MVPFQVAQNSSSGGAVHANSPLDIPLVLVMVYLRRGLNKILNIH